MSNICSFKTVGKTTLLERVIYDVSDRSLSMLTHSLTNEAGVGSWTYVLLREDIRILNTLSSGISVKKHKAF